MTPEKKIPGEAEVKILIVEDNLLNQKIAGHILKDHGFNNDACFNGKEAIELLKKNRYDLVLMDLQMPEMNGYETADYIRKEMKLKIPIIATAGQSSGGGKEKCLEHGMTDFILKPLKGEELDALVRHYLFPDKVIN